MVLGGRARPDERDRRALETILEIYLVVGLTRCPLHTYMQHCVIVTTYNDCNCNNGNNVATLAGRWTAGVRGAAPSERPRAQTVPDPGDLTTHGHGPLSPKTILLSY